MKSNAERARRGKISSIEGLERFRLEYRDAAVPRATCLRLDTTSAPVEATAQEIVRHFGLTGAA